MNERMHSFIHSFIHYLHSAQMKDICKTPEVRARFSRNQRLMVATKLAKKSDFVGDKRVGLARFRCTHCNSVSGEVYAASVWLACQSCNTSKKRVWRSKSVDGKQLVNYGENSDHWSIVIKLT